MPTFEADEPFYREYERLLISEKRAFLRARDELVEWLIARQARPDLTPLAHLRLHWIENQNAWSLSFGKDKRALFRYGEEKTPGDAHIHWLSIGSHDIYEC